MSQSSAGATAATPAATVAARSLRADATVGALGAIASTGISGAASIVIARELGVAARGRWAVISSLAVLIAMLAAFGLPTAAGYAAARAGESNRTRVVQAAIAGAVVLGCVAALIYLSATAIVRPGAPTVAVIAGLGIPATIVCYQVTHQLALTVASLRWYAAAQVVTAGVALVAVVVIALAARLTILTVVLVSAGAQLGGVTVCLAGLGRHHALGSRLLVRSAATAGRILRPYVSYALVTFATLSLTQVVQRFDMLLVNGYRGPRAAGLYAVAVQVTDLMLVIPAALGVVMFRRGARSSPEHPSDLMRILRATAVFGLLAATGAALLSGWFIPVVFGSAYRGSVEPLRWLLPGTVAFSLQSVVSNYIAGRGRPRLVLVAWLAGAVVAIGADLIVIPAFGIVGAAIVSSVSYALVTSIHVKALHRVIAAQAESQTPSPASPDR